MKRLFQLQYKTRIAVLLGILILGIIVNNITSGQNLKQVDSSISSIYKDRLLASTYICELTNHLYDKANNPGTKPVPGPDTGQQDKAIRILIEQYEATVLTAKEKTYWRSFKKNLQQFNRSAAAGVPVANDFNLVIQDLKDLSRIQAEEGRNLFDNTKSSIGASTLSSYFEISLAVFIGIFTLMLIGLSKNALTHMQQRPSLN